MDNRPSTFASFVIVQGLLLGFMAVAGLSTPVTVLAQYTGLPFGIYRGIIDGLVIIGIIYGIRTSWMQLKHVERKDWTVLGIVLALGVVGMVLGLITRWPNPDDAVYAPNALYALQHPQAPMDFQIHFVAAETPIVAPSQATSLAFDYLRAVIAYNLHVEFMWVYYVGSVALTAFLVPLAQYYLTMHFTDNSRYALIGATVAFACIFFMNDSNHGFAAYIFPRLFQGKAAFLSLSVPVFAALTLACLARPSAYKLGGLCLTLLAGIGISASAAVLLPFIALALVIAYVVANHRQIVEAGETIYRFTRRMLHYSLALLPAPLYLLFLLTQTRIDYFAPNLSLTRDFPQGFMGQLGYVAGQPWWRSHLALACAIGFLLTLVVLQGQRRAILAVWAGAVVVLYLNPLVAPFVIRHITTTNVYWRIVYLLPFPTMAGVVFAALPAWFQKPQMALWYGLAGAILVAGLYAYYDFRGLYFRWPGYKLNGQQMADAQAVMSVAPDGPMLAPKDIAMTIILFDSNYPQVAFREEELNTWVGDKEGTQRLNAQWYLTNHKKRGSFEQVIARGFVRSLVFGDDVYAEPDVQTLLKKYGFTEHQQAGQYVVAWRPAGR